MRTFTNLEERVIKHFFTIENIEVLKNDDNIRVYCRRDSLPMSIWPFLIGGYSRSSEPLAVRWLMAIREADPENYEKNLEDLVPQEHRYSIAIVGVMKRVEKFLSTWSVNFGHSSLKDSALDCFAVEGLSQRATKEVEDANLSAFQEKSTRYMDFSNPNFHTCDNHPGIKALYQASMSLYEKVLAHAIRYYRDQYQDRNDFASERAKENTIKAKAFDVARYCLPSGIRTSLGITQSSRESERMIQKLLASPLREVREIGNQMLKHGIKINPGLLKHVQSNSYLVRKARIQPEELSTVVATKPPSSQVTLIGADRDSIITTLVTALAYRSANSAQDVYKFCQDENNLACRDELFRTLLNSALADRGLHDEFPVEFKHGSLMFEITLDMGAFRDLQRHRVGTQLLSEYSPLNGYAIPDIVTKSPSLLEEYRNVMDAYVHMAHLFSNKELVEYCMTLAHNVRYVYTCDVRQIGYLVELRTGPAGHWSYRQICQEMAKLFLELLPEFTPYLRVNWDVETDRSSSENRTAVKLSSLDSVP
jgi:thymidylate synthase ThyX